MIPMMLKARDNNQTLHISHHKPSNNLYKETSNTQISNLRQYLRCRFRTISKGIVNWLAHHMQDRCLKIKYLEVFPNKRGLDSARTTFRSTQGRSSMTRNYKDTIRWSSKPNFLEEPSQSWPHSQWSIPFHQSMTLAFTIRSWFVTWPSSAVWASFGSIIEASKKNCTRAS